MHCDQLLWCRNPIKPDTILSKPSADALIQHILCHIMVHHDASWSMHIASRPIYTASRSMIHVFNYGLSSYSTKTTSIANDQPALHQTGHGFTEGGAQGASGTGHA